MRSRRVSILVIALASAVAAVGCGGGGGGDTQPTSSNGPKVAPATFAEAVKGPAHAPALAAQDYITALNNGDGATICGLTSMTSKALEACQADLGASFDARIEARYRLLSARVTKPGEAEVRLKQVAPKPKPGAPSTMRFQLRLVDGDWKVLVVSLL